MLGLLVLICLGIGLWLASHVVEALRGLLKHQNGSAGPLTLRSITSLSTGIGSDTLERGGERTSSFSIRCERNWICSRKSCRTWRAISRCMLSTIPDMAIRTSRALSITLISSCTRSKVFSRPSIFAQ